MPHLAIPDAVVSGQVVIGEFLLATLDKKSPVLGHDMIPFIANNYSDAQKPKPTQQLLNELTPIGEQMKQEWIRKDPKRHQAILQRYQGAQRAP